MFRVLGIYNFAGLFLKELLEGSWTERQKLMSFSNVIPIYTVLNDGTAQAQCGNLGGYLFSQTLYWGKRGKSVFLSG